MQNFPINSEKLLNLLGVHTKDPIKEFKNKLINFARRCGKTNFPILFQFSEFFELLKNSEKFQNLNFL